MTNELNKFFYKSGTSERHKGKVISTIILTAVLIGLLIYGNFRNKYVSEERNKNKRYTIGMTMAQYKNFRSPNPTVKYKFKINSWELKDFEEIPNYLHGKIVTEGGRYYVQFSFKDLSNCKLLLENPVPDTITEAPTDGWNYMPGYESK